MADLFFGREWPEVDWKKELGKQSETARIRAQASRTEAQAKVAQVEKMYGHGSKAYGGLAGEELARRYPHGLPTHEAKTARMKATGTTGYYGRMAGVAEREQVGREEQESFAREFLSKTGVLPSQAAAGGTSADQVSRIRKIAEGEEEEETAAAPTRKKCARGYTWNGRKCVPSLMAD